MTQFVFKQSVIICGKSSEIVKYIKNLATQFATVKELIDSKMKILKQ
ncbi:MAG TPA: hypothetical protein GXX49_04510 [Clostridiaceae bacterium]|nr:hypothetical protein [Clostridiaceae bacterium]